MWEHMVAWEPYVLSYLRGVGYPLNYGIFRCCSNSIGETKFSSLYMLYNNQYITQGNTWLVWEICGILCLSYVLTLGMLGVVKYP